MTYSENLTNKELLNKAMPLISLSRTQWNTLLEHISSIEKTDGCESVLFKALEIMHNNQARLEIMSNYCYYNFNVIDNPTADVNTELVGINI